MSENTAEMVNQIISFIEEKEKSTKESINDDIRKSKGKLDKNEFITGLVNRINLYWDYTQEDKGKERERSSSIRCHYDFNASTFDYSDEKLVSELDISFLTKEQLNTEIVLKLQDYLQKRVDEEAYGGFYGAELGVNLTISVNREVRDDDPMHMQGRTYERTYITARDEQRFVKEKKKIHDFIENDSYANSCIKDYQDSLTTIIYYSVKYNHQEFGDEKLLTFFDWMIKMAALDRFGSRRASINHGLVKAGTYLLQNDNQDEVKIPSDEEFSLACDIAMLILLNATDKYESDRGKDLLLTAKELGSEKAKDMLRFGTGKIPKEIIQYRDENVNCLGNDIEKIIEFKIKNENEEAYESMLKFIINLINHEFPADYSIKCNYKKTEYAPKTKTAYFWDKCAEYPNLHSLMKEYVHANSNPYDYYGDASDDAAVPVGGYATFALGKVSEGNKDIVEYFVKNADFEHAITAREFADEYIGQYGLHKDNISVIVTCLVNSDYYSPKNELINTLKDIELLKSFVEYIAEHLDRYEAYMVVERVWEDEVSFALFIEKEPKESKELYHKLFLLSQEED